MFAFTGIYYVLYIPFLPFGWNIALGLIMIFFLVVSTFTGFKVMLSDPADPNVKKDNDPEKISVPKGKHVIDENLYCTLCQVNVGIKSKHCKLCNKCVSKFDHHCLWLNTCIGERNYRGFFLYLGTTLLSAILYFGVGTYLLIDYFINESRITQIGNNIYAPFYSIPYVVVVVVFDILSIPAVYLLGQLFFLHIKLISQNLTTYEYILQQRTKREEEFKIQKPIFGASKNWEFSNQGGFWSN